MKFRKKLGAVAVAIAMVATASAAEARAPASGERADTLTVATASHPGGAGHVARSLSSAAGT